MTAAQRRGDRPRSTALRNLHQQSDKRRVDVIAVARDVASRQNRFRQAGHGHPIATDLTNPDFVALAQSFGASGRRVETTAAFPEALQAARESGGVALLHLVTDLEDIAPGRRLSELAAS